jgi:hypothetical protein
MVAQIPKRWPDIEIWLRAARPDPATREIAGHVGRLHADAWASSAPIFGSITRCQAQMLLEVLKCDR